MATKITLLRSVSDEFGNVQRTILFWYVISPKVQDTVGNNIPVTVSSKLGEAGRYISAGDIAALDSGDAGFEILQRLQTNGETNTQFRTRMIAEQTAREVLWIAARRAEYTLSGSGFNT